MGGRLRPGMAQVWAPDVSLHLLRLRTGVVHSLQLAAKLPLRRKTEGFREEWEVPCLQDCTSHDMLGSRQKRWGDTRHGSHRRFAPRVLVAQTKSFLASTVESFKGGFSELAWRV